MSWTEDRVALLRQLWGSGKSASEIAEILGGDLSRNAVIGKAHRLRLSGKAPVARKDDNQAASKSSTKTAPRAAEAPTARPAAEPVGQAQAVARKPADAAQVSPSASAAAPEPEGGATILSLTERMCKWPIGDPRDRDFHFCGKGVHGSFPYCAEHAAIAYQPPSSKRRDDDRTAARAS